MASYQLHAVNVIIAAKKTIFIKGVMPFVWMRTLRILSLLYQEWRKEKNKDDKKNKEIQS